MTNHTTQQAATEVLYRTMLASAPPAPPAPQASAVKPEPVAWRTFDGEGGYEYRTYDDNETYAEDWAKRNPRHVGWVEPLYTHPAPVREPLTPEQIEQCRQSGYLHGGLRAEFSFEKAARAIERAHGIGGEK